MSPETKLLLAMADILLPLYPVLQPHHDEVKKRAADDEKNVTDDPA
jgi:hypothetical protein